jgi:hypothetical protein
MIEMKLNKYEFYINALVVNLDNGSAERVQLPFTTMAVTYEAGRHDALEYAQKLARDYEAESECEFYFYIGRG